jgi:hypothetical protein
MHCDEIKRRINGNACYDSAKNRYITFSFHSNKDKDNKDQDTNCFEWL